ncbi:MAG TPA: phage tail length tape measure family protein, partial [Rhizomicrobium sp.]
MTLRQIAIRIGLDGKAEITNDLKQVGDTGDAAFQQIGTAANDATGKIDRQHQALRNLRDAQARVQAENASGQGSAKDAASAFFPHEMERQAQIAQLKAQQIGQNFQTSLNEAFGIGVAGKSASDSASMFESVANAQRDLEARAAALRAQLDPLGAAQLKLNTAVAGYDTLLGAGKITQDERTAAVALARKEFDATKASLEAMAVGEGVSATKARELLEGFKHLAEGAANGGISVRQLAMGFGDLARAGEGGGITALLANPYVLAGAAIVATLAVVAAAYSRAEAAQQELSLATEFLGRATGATTDELQAMAVASANADNISVAAARDIEVAFAKTGMVGGQSLAGLTALTVKFAHATDESMDDAKGALVKAFADPAHAGEQLLASLDALDDKTRAYMTTAVQSNDIAGAQRVLLEKLRDAVKDGSDQWTWYGNAMEWVVRKGFGVFEWLSHLGSVDLLTNRASLLAQIASVQDSIKNGTTIGGGRVNPQSYLNILQGQLADVNAQIAAAGAKATANASDARATQISTVAGPLIAAATPGYQDHESLQAKLASVNSAGRVNAQGQFVADPAVLAKLSMTAQQAADAQNAYNRAVTTYIDPAAKAQKLNELDIAALNAKTPAQRASIAEQRTALELAGQAVTTGEAQRRIDAAGALARAQAAHAINDESAAYLKLAEAYLKGTAAGVALEDGGKKLGETVGRAAFEGAKQVATLEANVDVQKRLNDAVASGSM